MPVYAAEIQQQPAPTQAVEIQQPVPSPFLEIDNMCSNYPLKLINKAMVQIFMRKGIQAGNVFSAKLSHFIMPALALKNFAPMEWCLTAFKAFFS